MDEFSIISKYFKPLATKFIGSLALSDDAAIISPPENCELVITKDAITQGIHFIGNEPPELIAGKALRVNLSDLAAMGATPFCYFLALMLPRDFPHPSPLPEGEGTYYWIEKFTEGLKDTQEKFNISLAGGDTTSTEGNLTISITAIGAVPNGKALRRDGAKVGDDIYVSGTLGDSALGLELLLSHQEQSKDFAKRGQQTESVLSYASWDFQEKIPEAIIKEKNLINRYLIPQPRLELGIALRDIATSAMDISDGLAQDIGHICSASGVGAIIHADKIPNSGADIQTTISGGDDYELLFTAPPDKKNIIEELSKKLSLQITNIGKTTDENKVKILDENNNIIELHKKGFTHF
ncbi:MAG: thiamine-phosphate kinase [Rickettsiales bacterium]